jgi:5-methyltetrahydropteroyltriglutamate--homocysteine methyltransferase
MCIYRAEIIGSLSQPDYLKQARVKRAGKTAEVKSAGQNAPNARKASSTAAETEKPSNLQGGTLLSPTVGDKNSPADDSGRLSAREYKRIEDRAVDEAIALQEDLGLDVVNDGEQRRINFANRWIAGMDGVSPIPSIPFKWRGSLGEIEVQWPMTVTSKIRRRLPETLEEFTYARARTSKPLKVTLPSPLLLSAFYSAEHSASAYPDPFELFEDGAEVIRQECMELAAAGCEYIQIDCPELTFAGDPYVCENFLAPRNISADRFLKDGIALLNRIADVPGVKFGMHICRGGGGAKSHFSEGGYEAISKAVFRGAPNYDVFLLEYDDWRSGSFEPLRDVPTDKAVILGLVSNVEALASETRENLAGRIDEASRFFPKENMGVSTRCGLLGSPSLDFQSARLRLVAEVARSVWS